MNLIAARKNALVERCVQRGYTLEEVMPCVVDSSSDVWMIDTDHDAYPKQEKTKTQPEVKVETTQGVGTELKKLLSYINIKATPFMLYFSQPCEWLNLSVFDQQKVKMVVFFYQPLPSANRI